MSHVLLIGYGNPLRRDDGFGWKLAQRLQQEFSDANVEIIAVHQLTPELAEPLSRAEYAIFADASTEEPDAGLELHEIMGGGEAESTQFSHNVSPQCLLSYARTLYGSAPLQSWLLSISARDLGFGEQMSPPVARALDTAVVKAGAYCKHLAHPRVRSTLW